MGQHWDEYKDYWNNLAKGVGPHQAVTHMDQAAYTEYYREVLAIIHQLVPEPGRLLDFGCGPALLLPLIREWWPNVMYTGADISVEMIGYCAVTHPATRNRFITITSPKYLSREFDIIIMHSVLTHVFQEDAGDYLDMVKNNLTEDGVASISIHTDVAQGQVASGSVGKFDYSPYYFDGMLHAHGLEVIGEITRIQRYCFVRRIMG